MYWLIQTELCLGQLPLLVSVPKRDPTPPLWLSYALMQTGLSCNQASNETAGEFLGIVQGCFKEDFESHLDFISELFWFPGVDNLGPHPPKRGGGRENEILLWKVIASLSCDNSVPPGSTREVSKFQKQCLLHRDHLTVMRFWRPPSSRPNLLLSCRIRYYTPPKGWLNLFTCSVPVRALSVSQTLNGTHTSWSGLLSFTHFCDIFNVLLLFDLLLFCFNNLKTMLPEDCNSLCQRPKDTVHVCSPYFLVPHISLTLSDSLFLPGQAFGAVAVLLSKVKPSGVSPLALTQLCCGCSVRVADPLHVRLPGGTGELRLAQTHQSCFGRRHLHR